MCGREAEASACACVCVCVCVCVWVCSPLSLSAPAATSYVRTGTFDGLTLKLGEKIRQKFGPDRAHLLFRTLLLDSAGEQTCPKFKTALVIP
jgi:hypothetical protein